MSSKSESKNKKKAIRLGWPPRVRNSGNVSKWGQFRSLLTPIPSTHGGQSQGFAGIAAKRVRHVKNQLIIESGEVTLSRCWESLTCDGAFRRDFEWQRAAWRPFGRWRLGLAPSSFEEEQSRMSVTLRWTSLVLRQNVIRAEDAASPRRERLNNSQELTQGALRRSQDFLGHQAVAVSGTHTYMWG